MDATSNKVTIFKTCLTWIFPRLVPANTAGAIYWLLDGRVWTQPKLSLLDYRCSYFLLSAFLVISSFEWNNGVRYGKTPSIGQVIMVASVKSPGPAQNIMGPQDNIHAVALLARGRSWGVYSQVWSLCCRLWGLHRLCGIFGGPCNTVSRLILEGRAIDLYAGMNLPMVIELLITACRRRRSLSSACTRKHREG